MVLYSSLGDGNLVGLIRALCFAMNAWMGLIRASAADLCKLADVTTSDPVWLQMPVHAVPVLLAASQPLTLSCPGLTAARNIFAGWLSSRLQTSTEARPFTRSRLHT